MKGEYLIPLLLLLAPIYFAFFKSYLTEKGRSAALKEDLNELTKTVESVKNEFVKEQELLKTDLQRVLSNEVSYRNEERIALINYHGIINEWLYSINEVGFGDYNQLNVEQLIELRQLIASFYSKAGIAKARIELLVEDSHLVEAARNLYFVVMSFHQWTNMEFFKLQQNLKSHKYNSDRFLILIKNFDANKDLAQSLANQEQEIIAEKDGLFDNYMANRNPEYSKVFPFSNDYESLVKEYLKK